MLNLKVLKGIWNNYIIPLFPIFILFYCLWPNMPQLYFLILKWIVYFIVAYAILTKAKKFIYYMVSEPLILALTLLACLSVFWSTIPSVTLTTARNLLVLYFSAVYIAMTYDLKSLMRYLSIVLGISALFSFLLPTALPSYGFTITSSGGQNKVGIFRHKNRLANAMAMGILTLLNLRVINKKLNLIILIFSMLSLFLLITSQGKGALAALLISLSFFPAYNVVTQREYGSKVILFVIFLYSFLALSVTAYFGLEYLVVDVLGKDFTLTGRTGMWDYLIERAMTKPLFGFGYGGFWQNSQEALGVYKNQPWFKGALEGRGNAHSGYIELLLQVGFVGASLMAVSLVTTFYQVFILLIKTQRSEYFWAIQFLLLLVLLNISETNEAWLGNLSIGWLLYVAIAMSATMETRKLNQTFLHSENPYLRLGKKRSSLL